MKNHQRITRKYRILDSSIGTLLPPVKILRQGLSMKNHQQNHTQFRSKGPPSKCLLQPQNPNPKLRTAMVFKGRFFSSSSSKKSSDSSSPSNSPRNSSRSPSSFGSSLRSASKKSPKKPDSPSPSSLSGRGINPPVKDLGSPAKKKDPKAGVGVAPVGKSKKLVEDDRGREKEKDKERDSVAPILASSLGLNKIKTRSGPLPQETFYGFRGGGTEAAKGVAMGASNLSRPSNSGSGSSVSGAGSNGGICGGSGTSFHVGI